MVIYRTHISRFFVLIPYFFLVFKKTQQSDVYHRCQRMYDMAVRLPLPQFFFVKNIYIFVYKYTTSLG